ncbi:enoyl-CoA hydratase/isomerase family protein [Parvularcula lutaonensis]|uniref:Enoyl-CoA hydratase/isomerase family protein n=1 Tax=Parvularcula lutaonensis TaxID=491923 RepID=A0ABV7MAI9_9PROT|nr:enoyl-CoA hydratase-related protein [Parvularcula lutaonensis]GGY38083.1 isohexenylglutaconyl-CoA hydratase [Parvularcula lutaonensis]
MTDLPTSKVLNASVEGGWLTIKFDDPARKNALSQEMSRDLSSALAAVADDRSVRGITLRGEGGVFCAGGDLKGMAKHIFSGDLEAIAAMSRAGGDLFDQVKNQPQPILALIDGPALAGGLGLACCADIVAVTKAASFALTETQLGIPPAQIAPHVVARIGLPQAKRLMLTGAKFDGEEALRLGLADSLVPDSHGLDDFEAAIRRQVLQCAPAANAATKKLALASVRLPAEEMKKLAAEMFTECLLSEEGREGIASFVEKRKPSWRQDG